jgi:hypothetical protein
MKLCIFHKYKKYLEHVPKKNTEYAENHTIYIGSVLHSQSYLIRYRVRNYTALGRPEIRSTTGQEDVQGTVLTAGRTTNGDESSRYRPP